MNYNSAYGLVIDLIKYLDDDLIGSLLGFIYNKKQFYNPFKSYKELLLCLVDLTYDYNEFINRKKFAIDQVLKDKEEFLKRNKTDIKANTYIQLKECFKNSGCIIYKNKEYMYNLEYFKKVQNEDLDLMVNLFNNIFLKKFALSLEYNNGIDSCIKQLQICLASLKPKISGNSNKQKFFNMLIQEYIKRGICYRMIGNKLTLLSYEGANGQGCYNEEEFYIICEENKLYLSKSSEEYLTNLISQEIKHYTTIENTASNKGHALIGAKTVSSYFNSIKSLDIAVEKLQEKIAKQESCHICNPVVKNNKYKKKHMCSNCQKLVNLIIENVKESGGWITQADIVYAIKQKGKEEETCQNTYDIRKLRYKYLRKFLIKLNKDKKLNKTKIEDLVNTIFKEKDGFEKFSF